MTDNPYASTTPMTPENEKTWAIVQNILAIFFEGFAPLIAFLVLNGKGPFITHHVKESLNFGITMVIVAVVAPVATLMIIPAPLDEDGATRLEPAAVITMPSILPLAGIAPLAGTMSVI